MNLPIRPRFSDYAALWLLRAAKTRRRLLNRKTTAESFYEEFFDEKDRELYERDPRYVIRRQTIIQYLEEHVPGAASILDVGCGLGDLLAHLPVHYQIAGVDFSNANVTYTATRIGSRGTVQQASIYALPYPDCHFDVVVCLEVIEHIENDAQAVRELHRVLKPGGLLIASVPYTYYWPDYLKLIGHYRHYNRGSFATLLRANGFAVTHYLPNYPRWHQAYTRRFALTRALSATAGRLTGNGSIFDFRIGRRGRPLLSIFEQRLRPLQDRDRQIDYSSANTSTFVAARRES